MMTKDMPYLFQIGKVVNVKDKKGTGQIQIRLKGDNQGQKTMDSDLPWAFPLLPKMFYVKPKPGEAVLVFTQEKNNDSGKRYWLGPINSQLDKIDFESYETSALSALPGGIQDVDVNPNNMQESIGLYPEDEDVAILGRRNNDIILKDDELWIRVAKSIPTNNKIFNKKNPGYIQLKNKKRADENNKDYYTSTNIVSDKINLITNESLGGKGIDVANQKSLISDESMQKILEKCHVLPYGDVLMEFINLFANAFKNHTHNFPGNPPLEDITMKEFNAFDKNTILSKSVKIL